MQPDSSEEGLSYNVDWSPDESGIIEHMQDIINHQTIGTTANTAAITGIPSPRNAYAMNRSPVNFDYDSGTAPQGGEDNEHYRRRQADRESRQANEQERRANETRNNDPRARGPYRAVADIAPPRLNDNTQCVHCLLHYDRHDGRPNIRVMERYICADCATADYCKCQDCQTLIHRQDGFPTTNNMLVCESCRFNTDYFECRRCRLAAHITDMHSRRDVNYCSNCHSHMDIEDEEEDEDFDSDEELDEDDDRINRDFYNKDKKFCSAEQGKIIKSQRIFSTEIECYYPNAEVMLKFAKDMPKQLGIGSDGSLSGGSGIEFRTPILQGSKGEEFIRTVCGRMAEDKFTVNRCCGLHIHLDGGKLVPENPRSVNPLGLKLLWIFYLTFEDVILSFLPKERRKNNYCRLLRPCFHISEIWNAGNLDELEKIWYRSANRAQVAALKRDKHHDTRYHGFNIHCLLSQNHLEVRFHSGTTNEHKILEWINLHQTIMDIAEAQLFDYAKLLDTYNLLDMNEKRDIFFSMLRLSEKSKAYFLSRAKEFADKEAVEDAIKAN